MKRGSALLVVLGMLSFMVVSAVAFSIFMRQSRLPSSFIRQRIITRQLLKAALAHAMSEIDEAVGAAKYPNVGASDGSVSHATTGGGSDPDRNYWRNRVFVGTSLGEDNEFGVYESNAEALRRTVSTFPFEGLAYIPPPLVNTVRYWARHTDTAEWKNLDYDSGRYAYTAVNVSDYLDINRLKANVMRDSSPSNRISLAFLFENANHNGWDPQVTPKLFDEKMDDVAKSNLGRLVSLADYNMALGENGPLSGCGFTSPFCSFVKSQPGDGSFYGGSEVETAAKRQKFVTDSWYPGTNTTGTATLFLTDETRGQPFDGINESFDRLTDKDVGNEAYKILSRRLDVCTLGALYDYVDEDNVPISLAIPTVERAPMLTGISLEPSGFEVSLDPKEVEVPGGAAEPDKKDTRTTWSIKSVGSSPKVTFSCCGVYPFKRSHANEATSLSVPVEVLVKMFVSDRKLDMTRLEAAQLAPSNRDWNKLNEQCELWSAPNGLCYTAYASGTGKVTLNALDDTGNDSGNGIIFNVTGVQIPFKGDMFNGKADVYGLLTKYKLDETTGQPTVDTVTYDATDMANPLQYYSGADMTVKNVKDVGEAGPELYLNFACWVRVLDTEGNTVDLVPAMLSDDKLYNGHESGPNLKKICGDKLPVLPLSTDVAMRLNRDNFKDGNSAGSLPAPAQEVLALYCDDPRFNWAPEDWYKSSNGDVRGTTWLNDVKTRLGNDSEVHRQLDVFQFVASQGYLQSMGELQFLPYLSSFAVKSDPTVGAFYDDPDSKYNGVMRTAVGDTANSAFAWKTHFAYGENGDWHDGADCDPWSFGIQDTNGGATVSPYGDKDLMMAALANTPYDYIVASENKGDNERDLEKNVKYCFNDHSDSEAPITWEQLQKVADKIRQGFESGVPYEQWAEWDEDGILGETVANIHDVDRKFLFSYWRSCFGNNQQLFLVFIRAEPAVISGDSGGHTPSQLGAKGVALVWREPTSTLTQAGTGRSYPPHRMRVLFYHQFE